MGQDRREKTSSKTNLPPELTLGEIEQNISDIHLFRLMIVANVLDPDEALPNKGPHLRSKLIAKVINGLQILPATACSFHISLSKAFWQ